MSRGFRLLWGAEASSKLGSSITGVALPLIAVTTLNATAFQSTLLYAATWLPWLLIGLPAGAWVDRLRRRPVMIACDLVSALLFLSIPVAAWLGVLTLGQLLAVSVAAGAAAVFFQTANQAYLPSLLTSSELARGNAVLHGTESTMQVAGPGIAGVIVHLVGAASAVLVDAFSFAVSALCLTAIRHRERRPAREQTRLGKDVIEGIRFVARDPYLRVLTGYGAASNIGLIGYQSLLVVFLVRDVGVGGSTVGVLIAAISCGGVLGAAVATPLSRRVGTARAMLLCEMGATPFGLLIPMTRPGAGLTLLVVGGAVIGVGVVAGNVVKAAFRQQYTPPRLLGRVVVSMQFLNLGAVPLGALIAGGLATAIGTRPAMWCMTGGLALTGLILLIGPLKRRRDLPVSALGETPADAVERQVDGTAADGLSAVDGEPVGSTVVPLPSRG
ncbi:MFS transporter [Actinoplanes sp. ATCC 53533]|uniref:MFS transporter n=1 Tax=Actinoplanes sp. ATCC 53533 TaxID=1288362 RepID=UPI000F77B074|nr:MFS transporter [Actinoplanes sp. ATCC 53533]RSM45004.1 MFS transporter [Actinoplanes sp. ATCC 53533]